MGSNCIALGESGFKGISVTVEAGNFALRVIKYLELKIFVVTSGFSIIAN